jgi:outer membrane protein
MSTRCKYFKHGFVLMILNSNVMAMDLVEVYTLAETNDPIYRQAVYSTLAIQESKPQARALLLPSANLSADTIGNDQTIRSAGFGDDGDTNFNSHGYTMTLSQPLFRWDRYLSLKQSDNVILQAEAEQLSTQQELVIRVAVSYFTILGALDNIEFTEAETKSLSRQLEQANQRFEVGLTAITDVHEAQAGFDRAVADDILADNLLDNARENLREITGEYILELDSLGDSMPLVSPEPNDINQWSTTAESQNMNVIAIKHKLESSRQEIKIQKAGHLPTLDIVASHGYNVSGGRFGATKIRASGIGLELNVPLYQGGLVNSKTKHARHRYNQTFQELEQALRAAQRETRQSYLGVMSGISLVGALKQALVSSEAALNATETGFEVGTRTAVDVVASERSTLNSKRNQARARYDYLLDSLRLKKAAGTLSLDDLKKISAWLN